MKSPSTEEQQKLLLKKLCFLILISVLCLHHLRRLEPTTYTLIPGERLWKLPLKTLKTNKAVGLDRISARLLKDSAECMVPILTRLFNWSLEPSTFPSIWKCGKLTALFKGGDRTDCNNYRPITVLPTISKILERAMHQQLYEVLSANELLTPNQFGFRPKLSTVTALAHFTDNILQSLHKGGYIGAVFLDLSKALEQWTMCFLSKNH